MAVDTLGYLLALHVTPANEQDRARVKALATQVQGATGESVKVAYGDQGYTGGHLRRTLPTRGSPWRASSSLPLEGLRPPPAAVGGGTELRVDGALSPLGARL